MHAPYKIAGQPATIAKAQRALGIESDVLVFHRTVFEFDCDVCLAVEEKSFVGQAFTLPRNFLECVMRYDVFHFHSG